MNTLVFLRSPEVPVFWPSMGCVGTLFTAKPCGGAAAAHTRRVRAPRASCSRCGTGGTQE